jgi:predicted NBD/HSP70 family sugar kinase
MSTSGNALVIKEMNINLVRRALKDKQEATKHQIAEVTGLSTVTVATIMQKLVDDHEVFEAGLVPSMGGRPAQQFRFNENHAQVLILFMHEQNGLDVLHVRVANLFGQCIDEQNIPVDDIHLRTFEPYIDAAIENYPSIQAIGFGLPGVELDGKIILLDYQALVGTDFLAHYRNRYQLPVIFENDVNAAAVGYCRSHEIDSDAGTMYLYFPQKYPPGGGIYINGRLYKGFSNYAGEVATIPLDVDWRDPALYTSLERISDAIAKLVITISSLLNPHTIVLYGSFLTDEHLNLIRQKSTQRLFSISIPTISLTSDFTLDYQTGMIAETLALLDPQLSISL